MLSRSSLQECHRARASNSSNLGISNVASDRSECGSGDLGVGDHGGCNKHPCGCEEVEQGLHISTVSRQSWVCQHPVRR